MAAFTIDGMHHALVAARLSAEYGIAVRHGCFCAHPYVVRLLGLGDHEVDAYRNEVLRGDHRQMPGAVRASAGLGTSGHDIDAAAGRRLRAGRRSRRTGAVPTRTWPLPTSSPSPTRPNGATPPLGARAACARG